MSDGGSPDGSGLRIAQLANFVGPVSGGMKQAIDQLGRGYIAAGAERILVVPGQHDEVTEDECGITVKVRAPKISPQYRMIVTPWRALDVLKKFRPTSIEVSDKWTLSRAGRWAKRHRVGSALFSHERLTDMMADWFQRQFGVSEVVGAINRRLAKEFDAVIVTSNYAAGEFAGIGANLVQVPLGVDLETFRQPSDATLPPPGGSTPLQLCYVGRMSREKWPQLSVQTAVELHRRGVPCELHMYGTGPHVEWLRELAGDAPVFFEGFVSGRAEIARRYAASHISLSVCPTETFGLAVLEALASGTPVITANRGGGRELVTAACGDWDDPDPVNIADAVQRMAQRLSTVKGQAALRTAARTQAERYAWDTSVAKLVRLHRDLAHGRVLPSEDRGRS